MEILQRLGIPFDSLTRDRTRHQTASLSQADKRGGSIVDPSDADEFFGRFLVPAIVDPAGLLHETEGLLARYGSMCKAYAKRSGARQTHWKGEGEVWALMREVLMPAPEGVAVTGKGSMQKIVQSRVEASPLLVHLLRVKAWLEAAAGPFVPAEPRRAPVPMTLDPAAKLDMDSPCARDTLDVAWDEAHMATLWAYIRRGRLQEAIACCFEAEQPWKAGILSGGFLSCDPLLDGEEGPVSGNPARSLWVSTLREMVQSPSLAISERAVYGSLIGEFSAVQPMCRDWQDVLWAAIVSIVERFVQRAADGTPPDEAAIAAELHAALSTLEQRFPAQAGDPLYALVKVLVVKGDWAQAAFENLSSGGEEFSRLAAVGAVILKGCSAFPCQPQYYDVVLHAYLASLLQSDATRYWLFYAAQLVGDELRTDALAAFWIHLKERTRNVKWLFLKEAQFYDIEPALSLERFAVACKPEYFMQVMDFLLFDDDALRPLLAEYAAFALRHLLLCSDWARSRLLLAELPLSRLSGQVNDPSIGPFVKEIFYYSHLVQVMAAYESWSALYSSAISGLELDKFKAASGTFAEDVLKLLAADWLGDVEDVPRAMFGAGDREHQLGQLRSQHVTDLALLLLALLAMADPSPALSPALAAKFFVLLADPSLELWLEFHRERKLPMFIEKLQRARLGAVDDQVQQSTLVFLQGALRSL